MTIDDVKKLVATHGRVHDLSDRVHVVIPCARVMVTAFKDQHGYEYKLVADLISGMAEELAYIRQHPFGHLLCKETDEPVYYFPIEECSAKAPQRAEDFFTWLDAKISESRKIDAESSSDA